VTTATIEPPVRAVARGRHRRRSIARPLRVIAGTLVSLAALAGAVAVVVLGIGFSPVLSPSMAPTFDAGDLVITRAVATSEVGIGDVVVLPRPDAPGERYVHRIVALQPTPTGPIVVTKGDNNPAADPQRLRITSGEVPIVTGSLPGLGELALGGQQTWPRIALIVLTGGSVLVAAKRLLLDRR
jgi:signal peptidase